MKIEEIDANFRSVTAKDGNFVFFDALHQPFALEGFPWYEINQRLYRVPNTFTEKESIRACSGSLIILRTDRAAPGSTMSGFSNFRRRNCSLLKSSLPTPHSGQTQSARSFSNGVPGSILLSGSPSAGS